MPSKTILLAPINAQRIQKYGFLGGESNSVHTERERVNKSFNTTHNPLKGNSMCSVKMIQELTDYNAMPFYENDNY